VVDDIEFGTFCGSFGGETPRDVTPSSGVILGVPSTRRAGFFVQCSAPYVACVEHSHSITQGSDRVRAFSPSAIACATWGKHDSNHRFGSALASGAVC